MQIILDFPVSDNERLIPAWKMRRLIASKKYRAYKEYAKQELEAWKIVNEYETKKPTFENQMVIVIDVFLPNLKRDGHGILKCLMDCMEGTVYDNDKWVIPMFNKFKLDKKNPRVEISLPTHVWFKYNVEE